MLKVLKNRHFDFSSSDGWAHDGSTVEVEGGVVVGEDEGVAKAADAAAQTLCLRGVGVDGGTMLHAESAQTQQVGQAAAEHKAAHAVNQRLTAVGSMVGIQASSAS